MCNTTVAGLLSPVEAEINRLLQVFERRTFQPHYLASPEGRAFHEGRETGLLLARAAVQLAAK